jgi:hypothetical protein
MQKSPVLLSKNETLQHSQYIRSWTRPVNWLRLRRYIRFGGLR